jgi:hypothetical protein
VARGRKWNGTGGQRADQVAKRRDECAPMWSGARCSEVEKRTALFALFRGAGPSLPAVLRDNAIGTGFSLNSNFKKIFYVLYNFYIIVFSHSLIFILNLYI